jgi:hypothetical protein
LIFFSAFILWQAIELFVLPIDFFAFRPWEALISKNYDPQKVGRFYPNEHLLKYSIGYYDNFLRKDNPRRKREEWFTDANGFRNRPRPMPAGGYGMWFWGNSNTVGAFNDQHDIVSEAVERRCGLTGYSLGAGIISPIYFADPDFVKQPPRYFVALLDTSPAPSIMANFVGANFGNFGIKERPPTQWPMWSLVLLDRFDKQAGREWARSRSDMTELQRTTTGAKAWRDSNHAAMSSQSSAAPTLAVANTPSDEAFTSLENSARVMADKLRPYNTELILVFEPLPRRIQDYIPVIERLRSQGYKVVAWYPTANYADGVPSGFWHTEDSHWTEKAMADLADRLCRVVSDGNGVAEKPVPFIQSAER